MRRNNLIAATLVLLTMCPAGELLAKGFTNPYEFTMDYHIAVRLPETASQHVLIISNRQFLPEENYTYERKVAKDEERFFFIVSQVKDSTFITSFPSIEDALSVFSNDKPFLVFVNGHGKNFEQTIVRGFELGARYRVNMIMFDWPTEYYALRKTARNARKVTENFALSVNELDNALKMHAVNAHVSVIFHSMGNLIARNLVNKDYLEQLPEYVFQNLVLNAAAVRQRNHSEWVDRLDIQERIYIVSNRDDLPLKGVKILRMTKPLGSEYKDALSEKAYYIDFSEIAGKEHNIFLGRTEVEKNHPNVYEFYLALFNGLEVDLTNRSEFAEKNNGHGYYIQ